jgi:hypothetical protein
MLKDGSTIQIGTFRLIFHTNRIPSRIETGSVRRMPDAGYLTIGKVVKKLQA